MSGDMFCAHSYITAAQKSQCCNLVPVLCLSVTSLRAVIHDVLQGLDSSNCLVLQVCPCSALAVPCCAVLWCAVVLHSGVAPHILSNASLDNVSSNQRAGGSQGNAWREAPAECCHRVTCLRQLV